MNLPGPTSPSSASYDNPYLSLVDKMAQMRYPYTMGAMIMQFPAKTYFTRNWIFKVSLNVSKRWIAPNVHYENI